MQTVAVIDGIRIQLYWNEHPPPHFHTEFGGEIAVIDMASLAIVKGGLPRPQYRKVVAWARTRKAELRNAWELCARDLNPGQIR